MAFVTPRSDFPFARQIDGYDDLRAREMGQRQDTVGALLAGYSERQITDAEGNVLQVLAKDIGGDPPTPRGFSLRVRDGVLEMYGGRISGLGAFDITPDPLEADRWKAVDRARSGIWYLRIEFEPLAEQVPTGNEETMWALTNGGENTVVSVESANSLPTNYQMPDIDSDNGNILSNGIFYAQLAEVIEDDDIVEIITTRSGLLGMRFCAPNTMHVYQLS